jgi:hypothetical protein
MLRMAAMASSWMQIRAFIYALSRLSIINDCTPSLFYLW